jgi:hypothetical protein
VRDSTLRNPMFTESKLISSYTVFAVSVATNQHGTETPEGFTPVWIRHQGFSCIHKVNSATSLSRPSRCEKRVPKITRVGLASFGPARRELG